MSDVTELSNFQTVIFSTALTKICKKGNIFKISYSIMQPNKAWYCMWIIC